MKKFQALSLVYHEKTDQLLIVAWFTKEAGYWCYFDIYNNKKPYLPKELTLINQIFI